MWSLTTPQAGRVNAEAPGFQSRYVMVTAASYVAGIAFVTVVLEQDEAYETHMAYMFGYTDGTFRPDNAITRAEAAALLVRTMVDDFHPTAPVPNIQGRFSDVPATEWFHRYVAWAYDADIIRGYPDGSFRPNNRVSREEVAAMVARLVDGGGTAGNMPFPDANQISPWARNYVYTAYREGWMRGDAGGLFRPTDSLTRAEMVTIANRILDRDGTTAQSIQNVRDDIRTFSDVQAHMWFFFEVVEASNSHRLTRNAAGLEIWVEILN